MVEYAVGLAKKSRPPLPGRAADRFKEKTYRNESPQSASPKAKKRTSVFKQIKSAGFTLYRVTVTEPSGTVTTIDCTADTAKQPDNDWSDVRGNGAA
ncbi:MAG: hypothetical protein WBQ20_09405 [Methyloceanibacter sp.]